MLNVCRFIHIKYIFFISLPLMVTGLPQAYGEEGARNKAGEIVSVLGVVFVREDTGKASQGIKNAKAGDSVYEGDVINTASNGGAKILLKDKSIVDLGPSSLFKVSQYVPGENGERQVELKVAYGSVRAAVTEKLKGKSKFNLRTPSAVMGVRGTITFTEVKQGDSIKNMSTFLNGGPATPAPASEKGTAPATTFLITQGQGVVTNNSVNASAAKEVVLNPGDQAIASGVGSGGGGMAKQTLSQEQFSQRTQQVQGMARVTDTTFVMATNFDRAIEQKQQEKTAERHSSSDSKGKTESKSDVKADAKSESKDSAKDSKEPKGAQTASNGNGRGPASSGNAEGSSGNNSGGNSGVGNILDSIATVVTQVAPPPPQITVSNMGISGAPTTDQILSQQTGANSTPSSATRHLTVNVRWQK